MKLQKNKIVFVMVMVCVVLFTVVYAMFTFGKDKEDAMEPDRIPIPDLEGSPVEYESKLEAIEAIKEERDIMAPQLYPDHMVDDKGYFNPDYMEYEKQRIIDSIHNGRSQENKNPKSPKNILEYPRPKHREGIPEDTVMVSKTTDLEELGLEHQLFFASKPEPNADRLNKIPVVRVDGRQTIKEGQRLNLRLTSDVDFNGIHLSKYTRVYGFVKIRPNRVLVKISQLGGHPIALKGYDFQDGREGIYVENHLQGDIVNQGLDETIREVNIPGVPQLGGIKGIFRKDNRAIKVEIPHNYQFTLKP